MRGIVGGRAESGFLRPPGCPPSRPRKVLPVSQADPDVTATIAALVVYPVKSCSGVPVNEAVLTEAGLDLDRAWMVVDAQGEFVSQRELPRMALIRPQLKTYEIILRAPGMLALHLAIDAVEQPVRVRVWDDEVPAYDMGAVAAQWFSDFLGQPLRLVRFDPAHRRLSSLKWTGGIEAPNQFSDGFPVLVTSEASLDDLNGRLQATGHRRVEMDRFRPNLVLRGVQAHDEDRLEVLRIATEAGVAELKPVKPCARCPIPNIDPATAESEPAVGNTLQAYRRDSRLNGAVTFGMNAIVLKGDGQLLRVGQSVGANFRFD
ncbi:MAG: MOSC N-terminal beta barrel domain-containing protein [Comamonadaceae bacterium]|nr:MOSC N-terminal beta barrel domain-containing protein [Comamonadaceae bacterium]MBK9199439.1 MOSC N-terminal beta barrel domain-containing protein [Betaproteobacteria bacterium]MBP8101804.1 MOSC N-terminal beta barrel domain-containing protein [Burkholderiaceae bacterium]MBK6555864.1 MOSC N-terminal beta barrel domain-containing protein [Comamonadaceae bacterium]MBK8358766.1 MOSC N-terminal beta barrel domain-containing protein [Comamonadaceae bacterium]